MYCYLIFLTSLTVTSWSTTSRRVTRSIPTCLSTAAWVISLRSTRLTTSRRQYNWLRLTTPTWITTCLSATAWVISLGSTCLSAPRGHYNRLRLPTARRISCFMPFCIATTLRTISLLFLSLATKLIYCIWFIRVFNISFISSASIS